MAKQAFKLPRSASTSSKRSYQVGPDAKINEEQHAALIEYLKTRLDFAKKMHDPQTERYKAIDKEVAGYMVLDDDDKQRQLDNKKGYGPKVYDVNIPLVATQADEAVTFFSTVFFPEEGPYHAVTDADKQEVAKGFSRLMNKHGTFYKHFTNFTKGAYSGMKYNKGLWLVEWKETKGSIVGNATNGIGVDIKENEVVMAGNKYEFLNPYNTLLDPTVHPTEVHASGEFFAIVEPKTAFRAQLAAQREEIWNLEYIMDTETGETHGQFESKYYTELPEIHADAQQSASGKKTNWYNFLSGFTSTASIDGIEFIDVYIWLPAKRFGLSDSDNYQIWRITLANMVVVAAEHLINAHGFLPLVATVPWDDEFGPDANSFAEMLLPYQRFSSFQMNVHQRASRKALYNLTVYDSRALPAMKDADVLGGKVPANPNMEDMDLRQKVVQFSDVPDTSNTLRDLEGMDGLMQKILPTDILKQVTSLERATQYQAAATVQGANRRNLKIAKTIYIQAFGVGQTIQMYNILQFQQSMEILDESGKMIQIDPTQLRDQQFEFTISDGLRGLDKLILVETVKDVVALLVQNPQAAAQFDIAEVINYLTTMVGDHTSFRQFLFENEFDKLTPEQKQIAFQLLQQAMQQQAQQEGGGQPQQ